MRNPGGGYCSTLLSDSPPHHFVGKNRAPSRAKLCMVLKVILYMLCYAMLCYTRCTGAARPGFAQRLPEGGEDGCGASHIGGAFASEQSRDLERTPRLECHIPGHRFHFSSRKHKLLQNRKGIPRQPRFRKRNISNLYLACCVEACIAVDGCNHHTVRLPVLLDHPEQERPPLGIERG